LAELAWLEWQLKGRWWRQGAGGIVALNITGDRYKSTVVLLSYTKLVHTLLIRMGRSRLPRKAVHVRI
jgi:hypothetical protein